MYKFTKTRRTKAEELMNKYLSQLVANREFHQFGLQVDLGELFNISYIEVGEIMEDILLNHKDYEAVALYYLTNSSTGLLDRGWDDTLAKFFKLSNWYGANEAGDEKVKKYWADFFDKYGP